MLTAIRVLSFLLTLRLRQTNLSKQKKTSIVPYLSLKVISSVNQLMNYDLLYIKQVHKNMIYTYFFFSNHTHLHPIWKYTHLGLKALLLTL